MSGILAPAAQSDVARRAVIALPRPDLATLVVTGADRLSWLNGLLTCDLAQPPLRRAAYGLAVARNGRILADALVVAEEPAARVLLAVAAEVTQRLREHLDHYLVMEDAAIDPRADAFEVWALIGPRSAAVGEAARAAGGVVAAFDATGLGGEVVLAPVERAATVREAIARAAEREGGGIGDAEGWRALRLERGVPEFGADFDDKTYPQEAGLEKSAVSFQKGCYLGQEVVCMLEMRGHVKRKLASLVLDGTSAPERGAAVSDEAGEPVGELTSVAASPLLGKPVALAMLKRGAAEAGRELRVGEARAKVVDRPA